MNNLKTIGSLLQDARKAKSLDREQMAQMTKINMKLLERLEKDQLGQLPQKIYVIGFVKNYAKHLGIPEEEALLSLNYTYELKLGKDQVHADLEEEEGTAPDLEDSASAIFKSFYNKKILLAVLILVLVIVVSKFTLNFFTQIAKEKVSYDRDLKTQEKAPLTTSMEAPQSSEENPTPKEKENLSNIIAKADIEPLKEVKKNVAEAPPKVEPEKSKDEKFPFKRFYTPSGKMYSIVEDAPENSDPEILPPQYKVSEDESYQSVFIHALEGDTWISYKVDDNQIKRFVLKQNSKLLLKGDIILLFMGNVSVARIFLNNQLISAPSSSGVKSLIFPQNKSKDFKLPLFPVYKGKSYTAAEYQANMSQEN